MAALVLLTIIAKPNLSTRNSANVVHQPGTPVTIWSSTGGSYQDGDGSTEPITYQIPNNAAQYYKPNLSLAGTCTFPGAYAGKMYTITASLPIGPGGTLVPVIQSVPIPAPVPIPNPPVPVPFLCSAFQVNSPIQPPNTCPVPFRWTGDFQWKVSAAGCPDLLAIQATRLELCWASSPAPSGPGFVQSSVMRTQLNLGGIYPIKLIRQFFPAPPEFTNVANFLNTFAQWYARRTVQKVWDWGNPNVNGRPYYNSIGGESHYNMGSCGGSFPLDDWFNVQSTSCVCFDLAAITQLGCGLLLDMNGGELLDSKWVFQMPNGYIKAGVLYGWTSIPYPNGVNNPGFGNFNPIIPFVQPPSLTDRNPFNSHAWVEILPDPYNVAQRTVLDTVVAVPDTNGDCFPEYGDKQRPAYYAAHIDTSVDPTGKSTGNLNNFVSSMGGSTGNCYQNNDFTLAYTNRPANGIARVGVWDINGTLPALYLQSVINFPTPLADEISTLIAKGTNPQLPDIGFNDSAIAGTRLVPIVAELDDRLEFVKGETKVGEGVTELRLWFEGAGYGETTTAKLVVKLHVYNSENLAMASLHHSLSTYQTFTSLSEHLSALARPLGAISLIDVHRTNLHVVRGNHHLHLSLCPSVSSLPSPSCIQDLEAIAQPLDTYLSSNVLPPGQHRVPKFNLVEPVPKKVKVGESFSLEVDYDDSGEEMAEVGGESSNGRVVVCAGRKSDSTPGTEFFAVSHGEVHVALHVAHGETLMPGSKKWLVKVESVG